MYQGDVAWNGRIEHDQVGFKQVLFPVLSQHPVDAESVEGGDLLLQLSGCLEIRNGQSRTE